MLFILVILQGIKIELMSHSSLCLQTKLAGRVLYYLLTTGAGLQTLGEEYCDISQVSCFVMYEIELFLITITVVSLFLIREFIGSWGSND